MATYSKKTYEAVAKILATERLRAMEDIKNEPDYLEENSGRRMAIDGIEREFVKLFVADNPRFNQAMFIVAANP